MTDLATDGLNAAADGIAANILNAGKVRIRTGTKPATPNDAETGTLLCVVDLDVFAAAVAGVATMSNPPVIGTASAPGDMGYCRIVNTGNTKTAYDLTIGTSGTNIIVTSVTLAIGQNVEITSYTHTVTN